MTDRKYRKHAKNFSFNFPDASATPLRIIPGTTPPEFPKMWVTPPGQRQSSYVKCRSAECCICEWTNERSLLRLTGWKTLLSRRTLKECVTATIRDFKERRQRKRARGGPRVVKMRNTPIQAQNAVPAELLDKMVRTSNQTQENREGEE